MKVKLHIQYMGGYCIGKMEAKTLEDAAKVYADAMNNKGDTSLTVVADTGEQVMVYNLKNIVYVECTPAKGAK